MPHNVGELIYNKHKSKLGIITKVCDDNVYYVDYVNGDRACVTELSMQVYKKEFEEWQTQTTK